ncbi:diguanylate cyclase [Candidatus Magnetomorum sp. HK-1]|nr:diguanylate cyclase [Candidatus Magnetomorum sp. HK-1]
MKKIIKFKTLKNRLIFWFFLVALLPMIIIGWNIYLQRVTAIKKEAFSKLTAIRDLKAAQLNIWIDERIGDIKSIAEDTGIRALEPSFKNLTEEKKKSSLFEKAIIKLNSYVANYSSYHELFIINSKTGKVELSTDKSSLGVDKSKETYFSVPKRTGNIFIKDIYYSKTVLKPTMTFSIPLISLATTEHVFGILVARIDLIPSLYSILLDRTGMGQTGETLIVNKDVVALNALRWFENAPLKLKINAKPATLASQGNVGIIETTDYRNVEVLAAYTYIPRTSWGFVSKQDITDIYAPIYPMIKGILILVFISIVVVFFLSTVLANAIANPILDMANVSKQIQDGDYNARILSTDNDEMGLLASSINDMAKAIQANVTVQTSVATIIKSLVASKELNAFGMKLLNNILAVTDSQLGSFYILSADGNQFENLYSIGIQQHAIQSFDVKSMEGQFGQVLLTKKISHIKDIPEDTIFSFKTFSGTAFPKEILTIPFLSENTVMGILSIANLHSYTEKNIQIIKMVLPTVNTIFSNLMANEKRKLMTLELADKNTELEMQSSEMHSLNIELRTQTEELETQNIALEVQRIQVEEANRLKSEFLSNMSHELRTPLNSVMALSRVLIMQATEKLSEEESNFLHIIERNGKKLLSLINDILDLSKIESGRMDIDSSQFSIEQTIDTIVESLTPLADEKNIQIMQEKPYNLPIIESDETRVHQIIQNILGNAVKFTNKGHVSISAKSDSKNIFINIKDTGIGISKENLPYIFEEFRQVDGSMSRNFEGTGLGLAIAQKAAKMLGGDILAESELDKGSIFKLIFPIKKEEQVIENKSIISTPGPSVTPQRKTILIIDDDPQALRILSQFLTEVGYNTITTQSAKEALEIAQNTPLFAITLDVIMPEMDGWEVLQKFKQNLKTKDIPVIMISVSQDMETGFALGAMGYVTKPVQKNMLLAELEAKSTYRDMTAKRILLVEDNKTAIIQIKAFLEIENFIIDVAENGLDALNYIKYTVPDGIILDLMMPGVDGFEVLDKIRASSGKTARIPVLILTAKDLTPYDLKKLTNNNIQQLLQKGDIDKDELLFKIQTMLGIQIKKGKKPLEQLIHKPPITDIQKINNNIEKPTILVVEDHPDNMITIKAILKEMYIIIEATDGEEGLNKALNEKPDLIILDISLPKMDGYTVVRKIRENKNTYQPPVIGMTAHAMKGDREKILAAGCNDYISKPIDPEYVIKIINKWTKGSKDD